MNKNPIVTSIRLGFDVCSSKKYPDPQHLDYMCTDLSEEWPIFLQIFVVVPWDFLHTQYLILFLPFSFLFNEEDIQHTYGQHQHT